MTEDFEEAFCKGCDAYLSGNWSEAIKYLEEANGIMVENVIKQGFTKEDLDDLKICFMDGETLAKEELQNESGDGPSQCLITFMKNQGGKALEGLKGYCPFTKK